MENTFERAHKDTHKHTQILTLTIQEHDVLFLFNFKYLVK